MSLVKNSSGSSVSIQSTGSPNNFTTLNAIKSQWTLPKHPEKTLKTIEKREPKTAASRLPIKTIFTKAPTPSTSGSDSSSLNTRNRTHQIDSRKPTQEWPVKPSTPNAASSRIPGFTPKTDSRKYSEPLPRNPGHQVGSRKPCEHPLKSTTPNAAPSCIPRFTPKNNIREFIERFSKPETQNPSPPRTSVLNTDSLQSYNTVGVSSVEGNPSVSCPQVQSGNLIGDKSKFTNYLVGSAFGYIRTSPTESNDYAATSDTENSSPESASGAEIDRIDLQTVVVDKIESLDTLPPPPSTLDFKTVSRKPTGKSNSSPASPSGSKTDLRKSRISTLNKSNSAPPSASTSTIELKKTNDFDATTNTKDASPPTGSCSQIFLYTPSEPDPDDEASSPSVSDVSPESRTSTETLHSECEEFETYKFENSFWEGVAIDAAKSTIWKPPAKDVVPKNVPIKRKFFYLPQEPEPTPPLIVRTNVINFVNNVDKMVSYGSLSTVSSNSDVIDLDKLQDFLDVEGIQGKDVINRYRRYMR